jgi:hypothetical protein
VGRSRSGRELAGNQSPKLPVERAANYAPDRSTKALILAVLWRHAVPNVFNNAQSVVNGMIDTQKTGDWAALGDVLLFFVDVNFVI